MFRLISEPEQLIADVVCHCSGSEVRRNILKIKILVFTEQATSKVTRNRYSYRACIRELRHTKRHFLFSRDASFPLRLFCGNSLLLLGRRAIVQTAISTAATSSNNRTQRRQSSGEKVAIKVLLINSNQQWYKQRGRAVLSDVYRLAVLVRSVQFSPILFADSMDHKTFYDPCSQTL